MTIVDILISAVGVVVGFTASWYFRRRARYHKRSFILHELRTLSQNDQTRDPVYFTPSADHGFTISMRGRGMPPQPDSPDRLAEAVRGLPFNGAPNFEEPHEPNVYAGRIGIYVPGLRPFQIDNTRSALPFQVDATPAPPVVTLQEPKSPSITWHQHIMKEEQDVE